MRRCREQGFTYLALLFFVAIAGAALAATSMAFSQAVRRDKEDQLLFAGQQIREAIGRYYERSPGSVKKYPERLEDLLFDKRYLSLQRYLRRIYTDPMTGQADWAVIAAPGGGIMGIHSRSEAAPIKQLGGSRYSDWRFLYEPPTQGAYFAAGGAR
jgi:type II secretory pathway pseudopilin PulG